MTASWRTLQGTTSHCLPSAFWTVERDTGREQGLLADLLTVSKELVVKDFFLLCTTHSGFYSYLELLNICFACFCFQIRVLYNQFCLVSLLIHLFHIHLLNTYYVPFIIPSTWRHEVKWNTVLGLQVHCFLDITWRRRDKARITVLTFLELGKYLFSS